MKNGVLVVGSLNMDFVVSVEQLPAPGATVPGRSFQMVPGGKGANQACAAARLAASGVPVAMARRVGNDVFGQRLLASLSAAGVDTQFVSPTEGEPTGVALIVVEKGGLNQIVVAPGANGLLRPSDLATLEERFAEAHLVLLQLESPMETVDAALEMAKRHGATTLLDPAPARRLPGELLARVDLLTPNETEALALVSRPASALDLEEPGPLAERLLRLGARGVILKLGKRGAYCACPPLRAHFHAWPVTAVDSTTAGDTFNGALAAALAEGRPMEPAIEYANAAAALSVTRYGAQSSIPSRPQVLEFLARSS